MKIWQPDGHRFDYRQREIINVFEADAVRSRIHDER